MTAAKVSPGNAKLGRSVTLAAFSTTPGPDASCPGASDWCKAACYAVNLDRLWPNVAARWAENLVAVQLGKMPIIGHRVKYFRIHVSGDFYSAQYVRQWIRLVRQHPDVLFWGYTRSWRVKRMLPALEDLRGEPNVQLFASTDGSITEPTPAGWRVAFIEDDVARYTGYACPEQSGRKGSCLECGYCFKGRRGNVGFVEH